MVIRIKEIRKDFETKGFFRIGLLPIAIAQGVVIEIDRAESAPACLMKCEELLSNGDAHRVELHDFQLIIGNTNGLRLACTTARPIAGGRLELLGPVTLQSRTSQLETSGGVLQLGGSHAGEFSSFESSFRANLTLIAEIGSK